MRLGYKVLENGLGIVPDRITKIDSLAFYGCKTLRKIRIPEGTVTDVKTFTNPEAFRINYI